ncbi:MAG: APC family permease [Thermogemmatispora sp.]|jgi:APA family basic amino acid/polyamine antiporter|uniref:APC family permease n=1 Tax=Thermogemmatispora sp. TaxID=1968838 RepID=UPI0019EEF5DA|nr:APC family permease [Thermogemmatispora sp.]MBE3567214.1 APC family permease [Thermogemmatispora sp.]
MVSTFSRKATGLVRQAKASDVFIYNVNFINIAIGVAFMFLFLPTDAYPGANMYLATLLCFLAVLPCSLVYAMFASAMPRSGGEYVYVSRSLSPVWGFVANWNYTLWSFLYIGVPAAFLGKYGISALCRSLSVYFHAPALATIGNWFTTPTGVFLTGSLLILAYVVVFSIGINTYMTLQRWLFIIASAGLVVICLVFLFRANSLVTAFNSYLAPFTGLSDTYHYLLRNAGSSSSPSLNWLSTIAGMTWPFSVLGFSIASAYIGGEIKGANRAQMLGMPGSLIYSTVWILLLVWAALHAAALPFWRALDSADLAALHLSFIPTFAEIATMLTHNLFLILLMGVGFALWTFAWLPIYILTTTRNLMAWALDGLAPARLAEVSERTHAPIWSIGLSGLLGLALLAVYAYDPSFATIAGFFGQVFTFLLTSIAAIVFPLRQREMFEASPVNWRLGRLPLLSVLGGISVVGLLLIEWAFLLDPNSGISFAQPTMLLINIAVFLSGFLYYAAVRWLRARQGIDLDLVFQEIPPE